MRRRDPRRPDVPPDENNLAPSYAQDDLNDALLSGEGITAISGREDSPKALLRIHNRFAELDIARPRVASPVEIASAPFHHVFVTKGQLRVTAGTSLAELGPGDALRTARVGPLSVAATQADSEILVWRMYAHF